LFGEYISIDIVVLLPHLTPLWFALVLCKDSIPKQAQKVIPEFYHFDIKKRIMRKIVLSLVIAIIGMPTLFGQIEFGLKGGIHSLELSQDPISIFQDPDNNGTISFLESSYGLHAGLFTRIKVLGLFVEPNILFNSTSVEYELTGDNESGSFSEIKNETFKNIDIPLYVGMNFLVFEIYGGPVAHLKIDQTSDIIDFENHDDRISNATYGFQVGTGLSIGKVRFQAAYEGNLSEFGEVIQIGDATFMVDERTSRILFSLAYKF
jgi:hypothetical protein